MSAESSTPSPIFRALAIAPLAGQAECKSGPVPVDKDRLDEAVARVAPTLAFRIPAPGGGPDPEIDVLLRFESWRDLTPIGVAQQVPRVRALLEARHLAERHQKGELDRAGLGEGLAGALPAALAETLLARADQGDSAGAGTASGGGSAPGSSGSGGLDAILDLVSTERPDSGAGAAAGARTAASRLAGAVVAGHGNRKRARPSERGLVADIDRLVALHLDPILHHPEFRELEAAWRGLRLLVQRTDFREPIALDLAAARVDDAPGAIRAAGAEEDYDFVVTGYELDASTRDAERASAFAEAGQEIQAPVLLGIAPGFFDLDSWSELEKARAPFALFDTPPYADWRSFRGDDRARFVALLANRVALRAGFGADGERARDLVYEEGGASPGLFGPAAWAVASVLVRAFARTGACVQIAGTRHGLVADLPLVAVGGGRPLPVEGGFGNERREDLEKIGISALQSYQRDVAFAGPLRTFRRPERYPDADATADAAQQVTLAYQLFATRFVKFLGRTLPELIGIASRDEAVALLRERVVGFLTTRAHRCPPDHVGIAMEVDPDDASRTRVTLRVQPELAIAGRPVNVMLGFSLSL